MLTDWQSLGDTLLIAVSKGQSIEKIEALYNAGQQHFAENYLQEATWKIEQLANKNIIWHFIGKIQSNKINKIAHYFDWVQSIDDFKMAERLDQVCAKTAKKINVCICVNIDREPQKSGIFPEDVNKLAWQIKTLKHISLRGLMVIPKPRVVFEEQLAVFKKIKILFDELNERGLELNTLSMGMSTDYRAAISAGSTMIRLGTALFGRRENDY